MKGFPSYELSLADDTHLLLIGTDEQASAILAFFATAAGLKSGDGSGQHLIVTSDERSLFATTLDGTLHRLKLIHNGLVNPLCLFGLSHVITEQTRSGILLHGALAENKNRGVILIAPSGTGKTTASNRLPSPWRSLSDDLTLVVRDVQGKYWAHPWPTWNCIREGGQGGAWDVQRAVPLRAIFHILRAEKDWTEPLGAAESILLLVQSAEQTFAPIRFTFEDDFVRTLRRRRFEQLCDLTRSVPLSKLYLSLHGSFWRVMEDALDKQWERANE